MLRSNCLHHWLLLGYCTSITTAQPRKPAHLLAKLIIIANRLGVCHRKHFQYLRSSRNRPVPSGFPLLNSRPQLLGPFLGPPSKMQTAYRVSNSVCLESSSTGFSGRRAVIPCHNLASRTKSCTLVHSSHGPSVCRSVSRQNIVVRAVTTARPFSTGSYSDEHAKKTNKTSFSASTDYDQLYDMTSCPHGGVKEVMRPNEQGLLSCRPSETLESIIPRLSKVTGLPVINAEGSVIGVISRKDIIKVRKARGNLKDLVSNHMTSPAITILNTASIAEAADLMLDKKIRRLPVVDENGAAVGIVSRSNIFKPLFQDQYDRYMQSEIAAMTTSVKARTWTVKYLYDGDCAMCQSLKGVLERQDNGRGRIKFVNIAAEDYKPTKNMGITYDEAMETIHAISVEGEVLYGTDALKSLFDAVGLGWATQMSDLPLLNKMVDWTYNILSHNRISLGGAMDAIIAAKRVEMSKQGVETCGDVDEECAVEW